MAIYEEKQGEFLLSTDKKLLNTDIIYQYLTVESYWAKNIPLHLVKQSIKGSLCVGLYHNNQLVGFARVITDKSTFAYLADVFILNEFRGKGLSKWMMAFIMKIPVLQNLRRWMLATKDAHGLYEQFGFTLPLKPERIMMFSDFTAYTPEKKSRKK